MNKFEYHCFVIMPYDEEFDDVYMHIKNAIETAGNNQGIRCTRLDESRAAGSINSRLLKQLEGASFCIADATGCKPNIMFETGYARALGTPVLIVAREGEELPFDLLDLQTIRYNRNHLARTLAVPLARSVVDTIADMEMQSPGCKSEVQDGMDNNAGEATLNQLNELKRMMGRVLQELKLFDSNPHYQYLRHNDLMAGDKVAIKKFEGAWFDPESGSHTFARNVQGKLLMPYCYGGDDSLTGVYRDFIPVKEYWQARFSWMSEGVSGHAFIKEVNKDLYSGAWWMDDEVAELPNSPPEIQGVPMTLVRCHDSEFPKWAEEFFTQAARQKE